MIWLMFQHNQAEQSTPLCACCSRRFTERIIVGRLLSRISTFETHLCRPPWKAFDLCYDQPITHFKEDAFPEIYRSQKLSPLGTGAYVTNSSNSSAGPPADAIIGQSASDTAQGRNRRTIRRFHRHDSETSDSNELGPGGPGTMIADAAAPNGGRAETCTIQAAAREPRPRADSDHGRWRVGLGDLDTDSEEPSQ